MKPKLELGERVLIRTLKITMEVEITKRIVKGDYDKEEYEFYYNFNHTMKMKNPWSWEDISEEGLEDLIYEAKRYERYGR